VSIVFSFPTSFPREISTRGVGGGGGGGGRDALKNDDRVVFSHSCTSNLQVLSLGKGVLQFIVRKREAQEEKPSGPPSKVSQRKKICSAEEKDPQEK